ncbi:ribbon-helix-helix domain-containing protein [[Archangium] primigenium]|uniref:ribbon-helix-helix domain-containing protein n=1 Tax=Melittangium TaxID=44 RepID=UPI00195EFDC8|nr:ribbon-helix-helix domain-containing protein [Archangium primigenium]MBM7117179.1 ribbon-helix-helix domain-containing protein [Archangium primigenium]
MDMNPRLTSVVFRLNREKLDALKELSRSTRIRQSEYLREAITDLLTKYEDRSVE